MTERFFAFQENNSGKILILKSITSLNDTRFLIIWQINRAKSLYKSQLVHCKRLYLNPLQQYLTIIKKDKIGKYQTKMSENFTNRMKNFFSD